MPLGLLGGYRGGLVDGFLARVWDVLFAFPPLLLAIVIVAAFGAGFWTSTIAIAIIYVPLLARVVRGVVLVERERAYVDACKVQGFSRLPCLDAARPPERLAHDRRAVDAELRLRAARPRRTRVPRPRRAAADIRLGADARQTAVKPDRPSLQRSSLGLGRDRRHRGVLQPRRRLARRQRGEVAVSPGRCSSCVRSRPSSRSRGRHWPVVRDVSLTIGQGEVVGARRGVRERQVDDCEDDPQAPSAEGAVSREQVLLDGVDLTSLSKKELQQVRARRVAMIFQDPRAHIDPLWTSGDHLMEGLRVNGGLSRGEAKAKALELLSDVGIVDGERVLRAYPGALSGGMLQRVMIAGALAADPELLIADEPTTALDVTIQAEIVAIFDGLRRERGVAMLFITHDLELASALCDRVLVMYAGRIMEEQPTAAAFRFAAPSVYGGAAWGPTRNQRAAGAPDRDPGGATDARRDAARLPVQSPLRLRSGSLPTRVAAASPSRSGRLLGMPSLGTDPERASPEGRDRPWLRAGLLSVLELDKTFRSARPGSPAIERTCTRFARFHSTFQRARRSASSANPGQARRRSPACSSDSSRPRPAGSSSTGKELSARPKRGERRARGRFIQIVFQDPYTSLDPRQSVRRTVDEVQAFHFSRDSSARRTRTKQLLDAVGLSDKDARSLPRELSGGQRQRAAIARALAAEPKILILDEAVSALDVSIQAQILNLLSDLRREFRLTYILISHDLAVVRQVADDVLVMYRGRTVEVGPVETILSAPLHPYTRRLLESVPRPGMVLARRAAVLEGEDEGCLFRQRCPARSTAV